MGAGGLTPADCPWPVGPDKGWARGSSQRRPRGLEAVVKPVPPAPSWSRPRPVWRLWWSRAPGACEHGVWGPEQVLRKYSRRLSSNSHPVFSILHSLKEGGSPSPGLCPGPGWPCRTRLLSFCHSPGRLAAGAPGGGWGQATCAPKAGPAPSLSSPRQQTFTASPVVASGLLQSLVRVPLLEVTVDGGGCFCQLAWASDRRRGWGGDSEGKVIPGNFLCPGRPPRG